MPNNSPWLTEINFFSAESYYQSLLTAIDQAKRCILLESYIFELDALGEKVIHHLSLAKNRGVEVKVLVDGIGSMNTLGELLFALKQANIEAKVYHPLPWSFFAYPFAIKQGTFLTRFTHFVSHINQRNHRKLCVIDDSFAWAGSYNICITHLPASSGGEGWQDHAVKVSGDAVAGLSEEFRKLWRARRFSKLRHNFPSVLSSLNPLKRHQKISRLIDSIDKAKSRIWIANAYFAPHRSIRLALIRAANRGVDVSVIVASKSDIVFFPGLTRSYYDDLLVHRISIYEWQNSVLHSKILLIDDYCFTGSSNLNIRSHTHDLELDVMVCLPQTIEEIQNHFENGFKNNIKIEKAWLFQNQIYIALMSIFPRILRYWL